MVTRDDWKYVCTPGHDWLLHHLPTDPFEQANHVYNQRYQKQKESCHAALQGWIDRTKDHFPLPEINLPAEP